MVEWTNKQTFKFIELLRNEPTIWNFRCSEHRDPKLVRCAWVRLSKAMERRLGDVELKGNELLDNFRKYYGIKQQAKRPGANIEPWKSTWIFYDAMEAFLRDAYEDKEGMSDKDPISSSELDDVSSDDQDSQPNTKKRRLQKDYMQEMSSDVSYSFALLNQLVKEKLRNGDPKEDELDLYGRLITMKLRQIPYCDRHDVMYEIDGIFYKKRKSQIEERKREENGDMNAEEQTNLFEGVEVKIEEDWEKGSSGYAREREKASTSKES